MISIKTKNWDIDIKKWVCIYIKYKLKYKYKYM